VESIGSECRWLSQVAPYPKEVAVMNVELMYCSM
jgi:hypothetical protein